MTPAVCFNMSVCCWFQILWRKENEQAVQLNQHHWRQKRKRLKWVTARDIARTLHKEERRNKETIW